MSATSFASRALGSVLLLGALAGVAFGIHFLKLRGQAIAAASQQHWEPSETVEGATARTRSWARSTTAIGTVRALQSISLRNELSGTVRAVHLQPGQVVAAGALLVELDVAVEQAELRAAEAESALAASLLTRIEQAMKNQGASAADVDRARAERDKAIANVARLQALIDRKRVTAPFQAKVGMVDLHEGQYLDPGTTITTLQGVAEAVHVDFSVTQDAAALLAVGDEVTITTAGRDVPAKIVALDARVETTTRNTWVRALLQGLTPLPAPGASVRVRTPVEAPHDVVVVPVSALRRGPSGDHVFVLQAGQDGKLRAATRRVTPGASLGDEVIVREGVQPGERIAAAGSFKLREGVLVQDTTAAPAPAPAGSNPPAGK